MSTNFKRGLLLTLIGAGAATATVAVAPSAQALDCSAYEVDSGTEERCNGIAQQQRQFWIHYRASGCNPGTERTYGPWYNTGKSCNIFRKPGRPGIPLRPLGR